ncbi:hypothetical protein [Acinetobacter baumannii]|uniref:hypothetical protein n=1 Tax=Acinetobacter baumannii TaxID=470 RepID=UPI0020003305|nr:hypothetical protein [Acinetobacter baumannii]
MNRVIIGVPHCRFMVTKTTKNEKVLELTEYFAVHKHTQDEVLGLAIKAVDYHDNKGGYHRTVEILEKYEGLSYSTVAEKVKNLSKAAVRNLVDELSTNSDSINPIEYAQSIFGREASNIFDKGREAEIKSIFQNYFGPIRSELSELILDTDEYAAYKGVQGSW